MFAKGGGLEPPNNRYLLGTDGTDNPAPPFPIRDVCL